MSNIDANLYLPLESFRNLLRAIYGEPGEAPEATKGQNLGFGDTHSDRGRGILSSEAGSLASFLDEINDAVRDDLGELILCDMNRDRLAEWMEATADQVAEARERGLSDADPEHVIEAVLHGDDTAEAIYGRRLVLAAVRGARDGRRYNAVSDIWMSEGVGGFAGC